MSIPAAYVSGTCFTVSGDRTTNLRANLRIQALQGVDGTVEATVDSSSYDGGTGLTTCSILEDVLTENLATIKVAAVYADPDNASSNLPRHSHSGPADGGDIPAAAMSQAEVDTATGFPTPGAGDAKKFVRVLDTENGYELEAMPLSANQLLGQDAENSDLEGKTLSGTDNQITVAHGAGTIGFSLEQDIDAACDFQCNTVTPVAGLDEAHVNFDTATGHAHDGSDSKAIAHASTTGQTADDHHNQVHDATDHSGIIGTESQITFDTGSGHDHDGVNSKLISGGGCSGGATPSWTPPAFLYKDPDEITIRAGRYYKGAHRLDGQYQYLDGLSVYWDVSTAFDVDVDDDANMVGGDVVSSWYSVFLTGESTVKILPFIRVSAIDYDTSNPGKTTINPADHDDGTTANDNFVSADDAFNGYRLLLLSDTSNHGEIFEIEDCVSGSPDEIVIDGDQTGKIAVTDWLQMIPEDGTLCVYLGVIRLDASGDVLTFRKHKWLTKWNTYMRVNGNSGTSPANVELGAAIPPTAFLLHANFYVTAGSTSASAVRVQVYSDLNGTDTVEQIMTGVFATTNNRIQQVVIVFLSGIARIRHMADMYTGSWVGADASYIDVTGFGE